MSQKFRKARHILGGLGKLLWWEGVEPIVSEKLYRAVDQLVLLFVENTWVMTVSMAKKLEVVYVVFLLQVTGQMTDG